MLRRIVKRLGGPIIGRLYWRVDNRARTISAQAYQRLDGVDEKLADLHQAIQRLDGVDQRLDGVDQRLGGADRQLADLAERLAVLEQYLPTLLETISSQNAEARTLAQAFEDLRKAYEAVSVVNKDVTVEGQAPVYTSAPVRGASDIPQS